jgi:Tfp pilus assembly protein PilZ
MKTVKVAPLMALILVISILSNTGVANAGPTYPASAKSNTAKSSSHWLTRINTKKAATAKQKAAQNSANALEAALLNQQNKLNVQKQNAWLNPPSASNDLAQINANKAAAAKKKAAQDSANAAEAAKLNQQNKQNVQNQNAWLNPPSASNDLAQINANKAAVAKQKAAQDNANAAAAAQLNKQNQGYLQNQNSWTNTQKAIQESKAIQSTSPFKW